MQSYEGNSYWVKIYIAGPMDVIEQTCREYVTMGLCVNVKSTKFIYKYGEETGAEIELIHYPKYPEGPFDIWTKARNLAHTLMENCHQGSYTVMDRQEVYTYDRRDD